MIDFNFRINDELCGGLNFQIVKNFNKKLNMNIDKIDFHNSLCISEYSFSLIEYFFAKKIRSWSRILSL